MGPDNRAAAFNRPLRLDFGPRKKDQFIAPAFEEPSAQWRVRYMFDRGFRIGGAAGIVIPIATVGMVGGLAGGAALGLVGGSVSVLCRSCAGRHVERHWVITDFKDAAVAGFVGGAMVPGTV